MAENDVPTPSLSGFSKLAQRKVFGVPIIFLILIAAAGLLYYAIRLPKGEDSEEALDDAGEASGEDFGGDVSSVSPGTPIFIAHPPPVSPGDDTEPVPDRTDEEWRTDAIGYLIKEGNSVAASTSAITDYLNKRVLSMAQRVLVDKAIAKLGPPPSGYVDNPEQGNNTPPPAVKQGNPPTRHTIRGRNDDTPQELTRLYYKREDPATIRYLVAANHNLAANSWRKGATITVPMYKAPKYIRSTAVLDTAGEIARKNGTTAVHIKSLNPNLTFPVPVGTRVRVQ